LRNRLIAADTRRFSQIMRRSIAAITVCADNSHCAAISRTVVPRS
jgi:hypothetical protein